MIERIARPFVTYRISDQRGRERKQEKNTHYCSPCDAARREAYCSPEPVAISIAHPGLKENAPPDLAKAPSEASPLPLSMCRTIGLLVKLWCRGQAQPPLARSKRSCPDTEPVGGYRQQKGLAGYLTQWQAPPRVQSVSAGVPPSRKPFRSIPDVRPCRASGRRPPYAYWDDRGRLKTGLSL